MAKGHCDVAMTRFHMDMSRRHLSTHDCGCTPTQNPVEATSNHMPATQSESALEQTRLMLPQILPAWPRTLELRALEEANWNVSGAARALGMERTNLHKRIRALGISREK